MASVIRNILGYSLFRDGSQNGVSFRESFVRRNCSDKWSGCTRKYQESDEIWLAGIYWYTLVENYFRTEFATKSWKFHESEAVSKCAWEWGCVQVCLRVRLCPSVLESEAVSKCAWEWGCVQVCLRVRLCPSVLESEAVSKCAWEWATICKQCQWKRQVNKALKWRLSFFIQLISIGKH